MVEEALLIEEGIQLWVLLPLCILSISVAIIRHYLTISPKSQKNTVHRESEGTNFSKETRAYTGKGGFDVYAAFLEPKMINEILQQNVASVLANIVLWGFVSHYFGSIIVFHLPFSVPFCFRPVLQKGLDIDSIPPSYITAESLFLILQIAQRPLIRRLVHV